MKFASFGRDRDLSMIDELDVDPIYKARRLRQTRAAHDLNDGVGSVEEFIEASREVIFLSTQSYRHSPLTLLGRVARYYPECLEIWNELANSKKWEDRFTVACRLYSALPEPLSDRLFNFLRSDKSARVREIAIDRYKHRPNERGEILFDLFDPLQFDDRISSGEVKI
jgi:hypothetical protein